MNPTEDLAVLEQQETLLRFTAFDAEAAWQIGGLLRSALLERNAGGTIQIELGGQLLFACATNGAKPDQADWIRRKRNTVHRFARSSYAVGRLLARDGETLETAHHLSEAEYAAHGGGFPVWVGDACVGSIILSGLPQRDDHNLVVGAVAATLGVAVPVLR